MPCLIEYIKAGKLRALAVTTATRWETLPDIPPWVISCRASRRARWQGVGAPKNMPSEIIEKLNNEINTALADPKMTARLAERGRHSACGARPLEFAKLIAEDNRKVGQGGKIRAANIKPE